MSTSTPNDRTTVTSDLITVTPVLLNAISNVDVSLSEKSNDVFNDIPKTGDDANDDMDSEHEQSSENSNGGDDEESDNSDFTELRQAQEALFGEEDEEEGRGRRETCKKITFGPKAVEHLSNKVRFDSALAKELEDSDAESTGLDDLDDIMRPSVRDSEVKEALKEMEMARSSSMSDLLKGAFDRPTFFYSLSERITFSSKKTEEGMDERASKKSLWSRQKIVFLIVGIMVVISMVICILLFTRNRGTPDEIDPHDTKTDAAMLPGDNAISSTEMPSLFPSIEATIDQLNASQSSSPIPSTSLTPSYINTSMSIPTSSPILYNINASLQPTTNESLSPSSTIIPQTSYNPTLIIGNSSFTPSISFNLSSSSPSAYNQTFVSTKYPEINISSSIIETIFNNSTNNWSSHVIEGESEFQYAGSSVSMSSSGDVIAVGFKEGEGEEPGSGFVRIYARYGDSFFLLGSILGTSSGDEFGSAVSMSDDGMRVAVGARSRSVSGKIKNGEVRVYEYSDASWELIGSIEGLEDSDRLGFSVDLSGDGSHIACGSPKGNGGTGKVNVYEFGDASWELVGDMIVGEETNGKAGFSVSLSSDGSTIAVGASSASMNGLYGSGIVTVYSFDTDSLSWINSGQAMTGSMENAQFGYSVALSSDGQRLAVGSNGYSTVNETHAGSCEVFELNNETVNWTQIGIVYGEAENEETGFHVSLSGSGGWMACSKRTASQGSVEGVVIILREEDKEWKQVEVVRPYFENSTSFGSSTSISQNGKHIVVGAPLYNNSTGYIEFITELG